MSMGCTCVLTNGAKIKDEVAVGRVLDERDIRPPMAVVRNAGAARLTLGEGELPDVLEWPSAVYADEMPSPYEFDDDDLLEDAELEVHEDKGEQGFIDLLVALAPYLDEPLIIQAAEFNTAGEFYRAAEWTVRPGATAVESKEIVALDNR